MAIKSQVRIDKEAKVLLQQTQLLLSEIDETQYTFGETIKEVLKQWLKSAIEVMTEPDYEPIALQSVAMEVGGLVDGLL